MDIHIGKPIANTQIYILDNFNNLMPIGVTGELCIAGDAVGAGYLNRPELTAEKFIDNPFGEGKMYKTGDLAYWREDGNIAYVGRNDFQVKIRGLRIELGEIENAICQDENVSQAVVIVRKDENGRQFICAFYTEKAPTDLKAIKKHISDKLPKYMMPHIFTALSEMPLTSSGKINRKALPEVDLTNIESTAEYVAPKTDREIALAQIISEILHIEKVGVLDNFFDLGGDSLKAIELIARLEQSGYKTSVKTVFDCDTVKDLAEQLDSTFDELEEIEIPDTCPATQAQMRVYTAQSLSGESVVYNVPYIFETKGVDIPKLENAFKALIVRHDALRTRFETVDGVVMQTVENDVPFSVEVSDNADTNDFVKPFDLSKAPLMRVRVVGNTVMLDMHHIICDGGTMPVLLGELNELYMDRELAPTRSYMEYALRQQNFVDSEEYKAQEGYWLNVYREETEELTVNTDKPRGQKQTFNGSCIYSTIDKELAEKIEQKANEYKVTPFVYYMAALNILLSKFSGQEDIVIGMPASGRASRYLNTVGMFVNTVAMRNRPIGTKSLTDFIAEVKENSVAALANQDYPYGDLVKKLQIPASNRNPLFDVMFAYQSKEMTDIVFGDQKAELKPIYLNTAKYDMTFNVMPRNNDVVIMTEYCTDLYQESTMSRMVSAYLLILEQMFDSKQNISEISAIDNNELQTLLFDFNNTTVPYEKHKCVHTLFEEQVAKTSDKTAVIAQDKTLTYSELNSQANQIAHSLIEKGVKPNDIVAFMLPRKSYLLPVMFGILKAGAAYMPIDPDYPQDRIEYMLDDSQAKLCITEDNIDELLENEKNDNPSITVSIESNYCVIYTSGSTGNPKGCFLKHKGISNFCVNSTVLQYFKKINKEPVGISVNNVTFDYFIAENIVLLLGGFKTVLCSKEDSVSPKAFWDLCQKHNINLIQTTPTRYNILLQKEYIPNEADIKLAVTSGEALSQELYQRITDCLHPEIFNPLGPSECSVWVPNGENISEYDIHIGKPIANTQIYILDTYGNPTPIGVTGELCIAGDCVGAGYLNRPELTAKKFVDNPFGEGKMYKTGDLAYWREDGNIAYVGRNDFQVKIRGLRIELGEIENAICQDENVSQAVVIVRKDENGRQLICAFYTEKAPTELKKIRKNISDKLPKYMMPHIFTVLSEMPLTSSGKINRKAFPEVDLHNISNNTEYIKPEGELEKQLASIMEEVLKFSPIGRDDDFFDLGGDSLKAIEFVSKAHNADIYFNLQGFFDNPTVKKLSEYIITENTAHNTYDMADFAEIHKLLCNKNLENIPEKKPIGDILLTGATGFLGVHILAEFIENENGKAYCIVRGETEKKAVSRMLDTLKYYFADKYLGLLGDRIIVINGDITKKHFGSKNLPQIDMVINAAATVKHYGSYKYFYDTNVGGTLNALQVAKEKQAKFIQISTLSVSGNSMADVFDAYRSEEYKVFTESNFFIEQPLDNVYIRSKFEAEREVYKTMLEGLQANVIRVGNLTNRACDMKFQPNFQSNAFLSRVKAVVEMGILPDYLMGLYSEFSPIDDTAKAIIKIAEHFNDSNVVFHVNNHKNLYFDRFIEMTVRLNIPFKVLTSEEFTKILSELGKNTKTKYIYEALINDMDKNGKLIYDSNIHIDNDFTVKYLQEIGFEWSEIDYDYIKRYFEYFKDLGYIKVN